MLPGQIPMQVIKGDMDKKIFKAGQKTYSSIELCRIEEVDTKNKVVSAYFFDTKKLRSNVPYSYPYYNNGTGIIIVPSKGALGIASWDAYGNPVILAFTAPTTSTELERLSRDLKHLGSYNIPDLLEGEVFISGSGRGFVKFDNLGGVMLSSSILSYIKLDKDGNYTLDSENGTVNINGTLEEIYMENYSPKFKIVKGKHLFYPTQQSNNAVELYYRLNIINDDNDGAFFGIGTDGNIHTSMDIIKYNKE